MKKLLILGVVPGVPEAHHNLKLMLDQLDIEAVQFSVSADTKMCKWNLKRNNLLILKKVLIIIFLSVAALWQADWQA